MLGEDSKKLKEIVGELVQESFLNWQWAIEKCFSLWSYLFFGVRLSGVELFFSFSDSCFYLWDDQEFVRGRPAKAKWSD